MDFFNEQSITLKNTLDDFISPNGVLNGSELQSNWFPVEKKHIFISHSHTDKNLAIALSGWLYDNFEIEAFVDSCIWGYANELLRKIDDRYCRNGNPFSYSYHNRNHSTSLVHMMLSNALAMMINETECLFFLNTPQSISPKDLEAQGDKTASPWIYNELVLSQLIQKKSPKQHRTEIRNFTEVLNENKEFIDATFNVDLNHLSEISDIILKEWKDSYDYSGAENALDILYELVSPPSKKFL